ncbi:hypothetical protein SAMN06265222_104285 [Neorhodopirellula lusitana]|uniref:Uncharacterized protein n=1 Tax=Neorhodopirellula lusitana TaxID=445327 RepID=A0ABY1Q238_9BACT|nr:hypothetical protein SAMN06265222_104285 [Neorhodopirellula lusitana]
MSPDFGQPLVSPNASKPERWFARTVGCLNSGLPETLVCLNSGEPSYGSRFALVPSSTGSPTAVVRTVLSMNPPCRPPALGFLPR